MLCFRELVSRQACYAGPVSANPPKLLGLLFWRSLDSLLESTKRWMRNKNMQVLIYFFNYLPSTPRNSNSLHTGQTESWDIWIGVIQNKKKAKQFNSIDRICVWTAIWHGNSRKPNLGNFTWITTGLPTSAHTLYGSMACVQPRHNPLILGMQNLENTAVSTSEIVPEIHLCLGISLKFVHHISRAVQ